jgi:hypothetical protein
MPSQKYTLTRLFVAISSNGNRIFSRKYNCVFIFAFAGTALDLR